MVAFGNQRMCSLCGSIQCSSLSVHELKLAEFESVRLLGVSIESQGAGMQWIEPDPLGIAEGARPGQSRHPTMFHPGLLPSRIIPTLGLPPELHSERVLMLLRSGVGLLWGPGDVFPLGFH
jgi:hypothetical protein